MRELPRGTSRLIGGFFGGAVLIATLRSPPAGPGPELVLVEVAGAVPRPGLHLIAAPTVDAALDAAGAHPIGDRRAVAPGDRVVLGLGGVTLEPPTDPALLGRPVDPNRAAPAALAAVPGLGGATALAIVADRAERGPFRRLDDLTRVRGVGRAKLAEAAPYLQLEPVAPLDLNRATESELEALPGVGPALAARILADRADRGPFPDVAALDRVRGIGPATVARLVGTVTAEGP